jgi:hypothetical protein
MGDSRKMGDRERGEMKQKARPRQTSQEEPRLPVQPLPREFQGHPCRLQIQVNFGDTVVISQLI